jgi:membrane associated rhomboid family serine protease
MFLPIGDEPRPRATPVVTYALIAINVLIFLLLTLPLMSQAVDPSDPALADYLRLLASHNPGESTRLLIGHTSANDLMQFTYGFRPSDPQVLSLFTSLFLHSGWAHLGGNMLFLWIFGANVEHRLGRIGYLVMYIGTGVLATLFYAQFSRHSAAPLVGASGAISGILGCYFWWFPQNRVRVFIFFIIIDVWRIPARFVLGMYLIVDNLLPFLFAGGTGSGVAYGAHIGGFAAGLAAASLLGRKDGVAKPRKAAGGSLGTAQVLPLGDPQTEAFSRLVRARDWTEALAAYARLSTPLRGQLADPEVIDLALGLKQQDRADAALMVLQQFIANRPDSPRLGQAHLEAGILHLQATGHLEAARQHFLTVLDVSGNPTLTSAARQGLAVAAQVMQTHSGDN